MQSKALARLGALCLLLLFIASTAPPPAAAQNLQQRIGGPGPPPAASVILSGPRSFQRFAVIRRYSLGDLRASRQIMLGAARLDFSPIFENPRTLFNVAERLKALPQDVQVSEQTFEVSEIAQGLVIHHVLTYRVLPGRCADPQARAEVTAAGASCAVRADPQQTLAEFSRPGAIRYVADAGRRQAAMAAYQRNIPLFEEQASRHIADLKAALANPARRAQIAAAVGEAETARLGTLDDDGLKQEVIDSATQRVEQTLFIPRNPSSNYAAGPARLAASPSMAEVNAGQQAMRAVFPAQGASVPGFPRMARSIPGSAFRNLGGGGGASPVTDLDLGDYVFLTGFTVANDYEWSMGVSTTINWCVVGCSDTYDVNLYAGFNYGFGLRFPVETHLKYHNVAQPDGSANATVNATVRPIEASPAQFASTGLDPGLMFNGQELVAQIGAHAGFNYNLPVIGGGGDDFKVGVDFTKWLPAPYAGGKFLPPAPGSGGINSQLTLDQLDLLGDLLNFGAIAGQVFPAVNINLHSDKLTLTLHDELSGRQTVMTSPAQTLPVAVERSIGNDSHFSVGNPVYNLGFTLTPGLDARLTLDLAVWSDHWDWFVWFPQLALDLPPGGVDFACHDGTTCVLDFRPEFQARTGVSSGSLAKTEAAADQMLTRGGCVRQGGQEGQYLCPGQGGMLGLCQLMQKNGAVLSCTLLVPSFVDQILTRGKCTRLGGGPGNYACPAGMLGLCNVYVQNKVINYCRAGP